MPRDITVTLEDGQTHVYKGAPDDVTPDQVEKRAASEFGKKVVKLDGGKGASPAEPSFMDQAKGALDLAAKTASPGALIMQGVKTGMDTVNQGLEKLGGMAGEKAQQTATGMGAPAEVAGAAGMVADVGTQFAAPMAAGGVLGRLAGQVSKAAPAAVTAASNAAQTAEKLVTQAGINWSKLTVAARKRFAELAQDAKSFSGYDKPALERIAKGQSLDKPINYTKGEATRDPGQLRVEDQLSQTKEGLPLREKRMQANADLQENLDILKGKTGGKVKTESDVGRSVDKAIKRKESQSLRNIDRLYNKARAAGELEGTVDIQPLAEHFNQNPGMNTYAVNQLKSMKLLMEDKFGNLAPTHNITLNDLEKVRRAASTTSAKASDGVVRHEAGELVKQIEGIIPEGAGGDAYKAARAARTAHAMEFEEPKAIDQLVSMKSRTDRTVALEDVWKKTVLDGSIDELNTVRSTLLKSSDKETRALGVQAWKDLRAQTIEYIKDRSTKSVSLDQRGNSPVSAPQMKRALDAIGDEKLDALFGKNTANKLRRIMDVTIDLQTREGFKSGSSTTVNFLSMIDKVLEKGQHVPGLKTAATATRGVGHVLSDVAERGNEAKQVSEAIGPSGIAQPRRTLRNLLENSGGKLGSFAGAGMTLKEDDARP